MNSMSPNIEWFRLGKGKGHKGKGLLLIPALLL
jgi:hypothetical protein